MPPHRGHLRPCHASNLIGKGAKAFLQVLATAIAGYFVYQIRRSRGGLLIRAVVQELVEAGLDLNAGLTLHP
jgi:CAAX protease family protein